MTWRQLRLWVKQVDRAETRADHCQVVVDVGEQRIAITNVGYDRATHQLCVIIDPATIVLTTVIYEALFGQTVKT